MVSLAAGAPTISIAPPTPAIRTATSFVKGGLFAVIFRLPRQCAAWHGAAADALASRQPEQFPRPRGRTFFLAGLHSETRIGGPSPDDVGGCGYDPKTLVSLCLWPLLARAWWQRSRPSSEAAAHAPRLFRGPLDIGAALAGGREVSARHILIASGSRPTLLPGVEGSSTRSPRTRSLTYPSFRAGCSWSAAGISRLNSFRCSSAWALRSRRSCARPTSCAASMRICATACATR